MTENAVLLSNLLTGSIPALAGLTNLYIFSVFGNRLAGSIPALTGLTSLAYFYASANQLTGPIPALPGLTNLASFSAYGNQLTGTIPALTGLANLEFFDVGFNELTGHMPPLTGLTKLRQVYVDNNQLTGNVPSVPSPSALSAGGSGLCPNFLNHTPDAAWDAATGVTPSYMNCAAPPPSLDIDGNGTADALTDGLLVIRYLTGVRGAALIQGAVGGGAQRTSAPEIEAYLQSLMP